MGLSRRDLLVGLSALGGYSSAVSALGAYGLSSQLAYAADDRLKITSDAASHLGKTAIMVGAGVGGAGGRLRAGKSRI